MPATVVLSAHFHIFFLLNGPYCLCKLCFHIVCLRVSDNNLHKRKYWSSGMGVVSLAHSYSAALFYL